MTFFYLSFCDITKPEGEQFLGACMVEADGAAGAILRATELGLNPGGEVAMKQLPHANAEEFPEEARRYLNAFVPRDDVMQESVHSLGSTIKVDASVCQDHNPVAR